MRRSAILFAAILVSIVAAKADEPMPLTTDEASKKVNEKVVVAMEVKSTGGRNNHYLNSEEDYMSTKNFTIFISKDHLDKFKKAGIESPDKYYKGLQIQVTGTVVLENKKPWIKVTDPDQIKVTKEKK